MDRKMTEEKRSEWLLDQYRSSHRVDWANEFQDDRAFMFGMQWEEDDAKALEANNQPALSDNEILPSIMLVVAILTENDPRFHAVGRETSDTKQASHVADLLAWIWYISKGKTRFEYTTTDFVAGGMGAMMIYVDPFADYGKGEIKIMDVDPLDLYIDPNSKDPHSQDASNILIVKNLTRNQVENAIPNFDFEKAQPMEGDEYPNTTKRAGEGQILTVEDSEFEKYRAIDRYTKIKVKRYNVYDPQSDFEDILDKEQFAEFLQRQAVIVTKMGQERVITKPDEVEEVIMQYEMYGLGAYDGTYHYMIDPMTGGMEMKPGVEHEGAVPNSTTRIEIVTILQLVNEGYVIVNEPLVDRIKRVYTIGGVKVSESVMPISNYPIVTCKHHDNRNPYPHGDVRLVKPLQEQLNKIDSLIIAYNTNIANVKAFLPKGAYDKKDLQERWGKAGAQLFEYEADEKAIPLIVQLTQMSNSFYQQRQNLILQIQRIIGAYAMQDGDVSAAPPTKGGTILMDEMMQRRTAAKRSKLEGMLNELAKVIVEMMPKVYTERKAIRLIVPNRNPKTTVLNEEKNTGDKIEIVNDVTVGRYDVQVISGSMLPTNKMVRREMLENMYVNGIIKNPRWIIQETDLPNIDEVLESEDLINQMSGQLNQMQEVIDKLNGDMQTYERELRHADRQIEKEKTKSNLKAAEYKVKESVNYAQKVLKDLVKDKAQESESK